VPIETDVELIILQHPTEVSHAKGTAKILTLSLNNCRCLVGEDFSQHDELNQLLAEPGYSNLLVYPREDAMTPEQLLGQKAPSGRNEKADKIRLLLIDGTWRKAYKIYQLSANLHCLPALTLNEKVKGNYRIRKAPSETGLSTVEAGYQVLTALAPEADFSLLLDAFDRMIEFQIAQMPPGTYERNYQKG
jgi:DTW domain-containing protein YfiP